MKIDFKKIVNKNSLVSPVLHDFLYNSQTLCSKFYFYNKLNDMELQILEVKYSIIFILFFLEVKHILTLSLSIKS